MRLPTLAAAFLLCAAHSASAAPDMGGPDAGALPQPASPLVQAFVQNAGMGNQFEMTLSQMALEKSQDPAVRSFAQRMLNDHRKAELALERAAAPSGVATHFMFDKAHQDKLDEVASLSGKAFDDDFWIIQRNAHAEAIAGLGDYVMTGSDPALAVWARQTLPVVLDHQRMIADMTGTSAVALQ